jgi:hypothetical protein
VKSAFHALACAALLAACSSVTQDYGNDKGAFGQAFTWEWRNQNAPPAAAAVGAKPPVDANKERQEFEEWKRKNQR